MSFPDVNDAFPELDNRYNTKLKSALLLGAKADGFVILVNSADPSSTDVRGGIDKFNHAIPFDTVKAAQAAGAGEPSEVEVLVRTGTYAENDIVMNVDMTLDDDVILGTSGTLSILDYTSATRDLTINGLGAFVGGSTLEANTYFDFGTTSFSHTINCKKFTLSGVFGFVDQIVTGVPSITINNTEESVITDTRKNPFGATSFGLNVTLDGDWKQTGIANGDHDFMRIESGGVFTIKNGTFIQESLTASNRGFILFSGGVVNVTDCTVVCQQSFVRDGGASTDNINVTRSKITMNETTGNTDGLAYPVLSEQTFLDSTFIALNGRLIRMNNSGSAAGNMTATRCIFDARGASDNVMEGATFSNTPIAGWLKTFFDCQFISGNSATSAFTRGGLTDYEVNADLCSSQKQDGTNLQVFPTAANPVNGIIDALITPDLITTQDLKNLLLFANIDANRYINGTIFVSPTAITITLSKASKYNQLISFDVDGGAVKLPVISAAPTGSEVPLNWDARITCPSSSLSGFDIQDSASTVLFSIVPGQTILVLAEDDSPIVWTQSNTVANNEANTTVHQRLIGGVPVVIGISLAEGSGNVLTDFIGEVKAVFGANQPAWSTSIPGYDKRFENSLQWVGGVADPGIGLTIPANARFDLVPGARETAGFNCRPDVDFDESGNELQVIFKAQNVPSFEGLAMRMESGVANPDKGKIVIELGDGTSFTSFTADTALTDDVFEHLLFTFDVLKVAAGVSTGTMRLFYGKTLVIEAQGVRFKPSTSPTATIAVETFGANLNAFKGFLNAATLGIDPFFLTENHVNGIRETQKLGIGLIIETTDVTVTESGGTVSLNLQQLGGGDLTVITSKGLVHFDTTPAATIALTTGSDVSPTDNFVYILESTGVLTVSTTGFPVEEHAAIATVVVQSATGVASDGVYKLHSWIDHFSLGGDNGHLSHINAWIRSQHATHISGANLTPTITTNGGSLDNFDIATTAGVTRQLHEVDFPVRDTGASDPVFVINDPTTAFVEYADLNLIIQDEAGTTLRGNNDRYNLVIWGVASSVEADAKIFVNLPTGKYAGGGGGLDQDAIDDVNRTANFAIPSSFVGVGFLIARLTVKFTTGSSGTLAILSNQSLLGLIPGITAGGTTSAKINFSTDEITIFDPADPTKIADFDVSSIAPAKTRTIQMPDQNSNLANLDGFIITVDTANGAATDTRVDGLSKFDQTIPWKTVKAAHDAAAGEPDIVRVHVRSGAYSDSAAFNMEVSTHMDDGVVYTYTGTGIFLSANVNITGLGEILNNDALSGAMFRVPVDSITLLEFRKTTHTSSFQFIRVSESATTQLTVRVKEGSTFTSVRSISIDGICGKLTWEGDITRSADANGEFTFFPMAGSTVIDVKFIGDITDGVTTTVPFFKFDPFGSLYTFTYIGNAVVIARLMENIADPVHVIIKDSFIDKTGTGTASVLDLTNAKLTLINSRIVSQERACVRVTSDATGAGEILIDSCHLETTAGIEPPMLVEGSTSSPDIINIKNTTFVCSTAVVEATHAGSVSGDPLSGSVPVSIRANGNTSIKQDLSRFDVVGKDLITDQTSHNTPDDIPLMAFKNADQDLVSSIALQNDNRLFFHMPVGKYRIEGMFYCSEPIGNPGIKFDVANNDGLTGTFTVSYQSLVGDVGVGESPGHAGSVDFVRNDFNDVSATIEILNGTEDLIKMTGFADITVAGTFQLKWAQGNDDTDLIRVKKDSFLTATRMRTS